MADPLLSWQLDPPRAAEDALDSIRLGLQIDQPAARKGIFLLTSVIEVPHSNGSLYSGPNKITKESLAQVAAQAWHAMNNRKDELLDEYERMSQTTLKKSNRKLPTVVSVMHTPSKLFISSSAKKSGRASWTSTKNSSELASIGLPKEWNMFVIQALEQCGLFDQGEVRHRTQANCAEMLCLHLWSLCPTSRLDDLDFCLIVAVWLDKDTGEVVVARPCMGDGCQEVLEGLQRTTNLEFVTKPKIREESFEISILGIKHHYSIIPSNPDASGWAKIPEGGFQGFQTSILGPKHHYSIMPSDHGGRTWAKNGLYQAPNFSPFQEFKMRYRQGLCPASENKCLRSQRRDLSIPNLDEAQYDKDEEDKARMRPVAAPTLADRLACKFWQ